METYSPSTLINVGKYPVFPNNRGKKSPDYLHCEVGEGRTCLLSETFGLGL